MLSSRLHRSILKRTFSTSASSRKTAFTWHSLYGWNDVGTGPFIASDVVAGVQPIGYGVNHPDTKRRAFEVIEASGLLKELEKVEATKATEENVLLFHHQEYLDHVKAGSEQYVGFDVGDGITHFGKGGYEIGLLSLGGAINVMQSVLGGEASNGYALINPPGHHAQPEAGMGFCMFNNVGICAELALKSGLKKVAIVDDGNYPKDSGHATDRGAGEGFGYNINIPMPPGSGNPGYEYAFDKVICPALMQFKPDLILVASGADASIMDPLGRQMVTSKGFRAFVTKLKAVADAVCGGKLVHLQEGGYSPYYVPMVVHAMVEELSGVSTLKDAFDHVEDITGSNCFAPGQKELVDSIVPHLADIA
ncbi:hypothetical protein MNV49_000668 [Pseudohyphozyma bogoriensis]|nr:hypothetical protein MNV49_000668 [Pseudohyphozyma bogoriensis]